MHSTSVMLLLMNKERPSDAYYLYLLHIAMFLIRLFYASCVFTCDCTLTIVRCMSDTYNTSHLALRRMPESFMKRLLHTSLPVFSPSRTRAARNVNRCQRVELCRLLVSVSSAPAAAAAAAAVMAPDEFCYIKYTSPSCDRWRWSCLQSRRTKPILADACRRVLSPPTDPTSGHKVREDDVT